MTTNWKLPAPGGIVWCLIPEVSNIEPGPKPRPAFVMSVDRCDNGDYVRVVSGTSQHMTRLKTGEVAIRQASHPATYALAGLTSKDSLNKWSDFWRGFSLFHQVGFHLVLARI